jgi:hypothetical protein
MTLSQKAQQKKREKKAAKRKEASKAAAKQTGMLTFAREWTAAAQAPVADVLAPKALFERGIGTVWFGRQLPAGRYALAGFLVDTFCLGVKNAMANILSAEKYREVIERALANESVERMHPACGRKLVEQAVAYAGDLGLDPHPDYKLGKLIFGDVDAAACPVSFNFGREGKPFYVSGPDDTPAVQRRILKQLERRCGSGNFDYLLGIPDVE